MLIKVSCSAISFISLQWIVATALLALLAVAPAAIAQRQTFTFDIPAQTLDAALRAFAHTSRQQILFEGRVVREKRSVALVGEYSVEEGLDILLKGTGLSASRGTRGAFVIAAAGDRNAKSIAEMQLTQANTAQGSNTQGTEKVEDSPKESTDSSANKIQEIVVTAQRRDERLQDVPISITVLRGGDLDSSNALGIAEHLARVPGVTTLPSGAANVVMIRGVAPVSTLVGGSSTTGFYLDSVPFGLVFSPITPDANVYDLERVEVLRGPQGTLYGASALNGVVRILTKDADLQEFDLKGRVSTSSTKGGTSNLRGDIALNVPLVQDKLAARAVVGYTDWGGWIDQPDRDNVNDGLTRNARLKVNAKPTENFGLGLSYWRERDLFGAPDSADSSGMHISRFEEETTNEFDTYGLTAEYLFPAFSVKSMTSYLTYARDTTSDLGAQIGVPFFTTLSVDLSSRVFSEEVNLTSSGKGAWRWSSGAMYRDAQENLHVEFPSVWTSPQSQDFDSKSYAIFGQLTRLFLDERLELTGGARFFHDRLEVFGYNPGQDPNGPPMMGQSQEFEAWTPSAMLTWHANQERMFYASYNQGFRSGLAQALVTIALYPNVPPAKPDELTNYEVGSKGSLWGNLLTYDTSVFYIDWNDVQLFTSLPIPGQAVGSAPVTLNVGSASGFGIDAAVTLHPLTGLDISAAIGWNDLQSDRIVRTDGYAVLLEGQRLNLSAEYTLSGSIDYSFPLLGNFKGRLSASANYRSPVMSGAGNPSAPDEPMILSSDKMLIARASLTVLAPKNWEISLYGENLGNETGRLFPSLSQFGENSRVRPRTIGVQFEYGFR